jgi:hypothetical protein
LLARLAAKPHLALVLQAPTAVIDERWRTKVEPFPDTPEARVVRNRYYAERALQRGVTALDTALPIDVLRHVVARLIDQASSAERE